MDFKLGMPKLVFINVADYNQHENTLGPDSNENQRLIPRQLEAKHRLCIKLFNSVAGHGVRE